MSTITVTPEVEALARYEEASAAWELAHPAGTEVLARNLTGTVRVFPRHWVRYPGWVAVDFDGTLQLVRISDLTVLTTPIH